MQKVAMKTLKDEIDAYNNDAAILSRTSNW